MKIEEKLRPWEGEQDFKEIWPKEKIRSLEGEEGFKWIWPTDLLFDPS